MARINYIDGLKGVCILFMVMGHVMQISLNIGNTTFNRFYSSFHMPIFFFLSGIFAYKHFEKWNYEEVFIYLKNKIKRLFLPFITIGSLYAYFFEDNITDLLSGKFNGYWFLPSLFFCMLIDVIVVYLSKGIVKKANVLVELLIRILTFMIIVYLYHITGHPYLRGAAFHYCFFIFGVLVSQKYPFKKIICTSNVLYTFCILMYILFWDFRIPYGFNIIAFFSIIILNKLFFRFQRKIPNFFLILGKYSLEIYVFHRFFLPSMDGISSGLLRFMAFDKSENFIIFLCLSLIVSIPICVISILTANIIKHSNLLNKICFGK